MNPRRRRQKKMIERNLQVGNVQVPVEVTSPVVVSESAIVVESIQEVEEESFVSVVEEKVEE